MPTTTLYSMSAVAGVLAGISIITGTALQDLLKNPKGAFFNFLGALIGLFGVTGMYLWQRDEAGIFGLVAYGMLFVGLALIACNDYSGTFVIPGLSEESISRLAKGPGVQALMISSFIFLIGEILFSVSTIMAGVFPWIPSLLFMVGFFATPMRPVKQSITFVGLTLSGAGLIWWSVSLFIMAGSI